MTKLKDIYNDLMTSEIELKNFQNKLEVLSNEFDEFNQNLSSKNRNDIVQFIENKQEYKEQLQKIKNRKKSFITSVVSGIALGLLINHSLLIAALIGFISLCLNITISDISIKKLICSYTNIKKITEQYNYTEVNLNELYHLKSEILKTNDQMRLCQEEEERKKRDFFDKLEEEINRREETVLPITITSADIVPELKVQRVLSFRRNKNE